MNTASFDEMRRRGTRRVRAAWAAIVLAAAAGAAAAAEPQIDVPDEAREAVAVVDRFAAALAAGDLEAAGAALDPGVVILESGGAEHSATEYLGGHAKDDAAFLKTARQRPVARTARVSGDIAWIATEGEMEYEKGGVAKSAASTETMILRRTGDSWKIVHVHWSSGQK
jgi:ketosteroid isomerase-like protein